MVAGDDLVGAGLDGATPCGREVESSPILERSGGDSFAIGSDDPVGGRLGSVRVARGHFMLGVGAGDAAEVGNAFAEVAGEAERHAQGSLGGGAFEVILRDFDGGVQGFAGGKEGGSIGGDAHGFFRSW